MSSEEQFIGSSRSSVIDLTILSLLCGTSLPLFIRAIVKLIRRGLDRRSRQVVLWVCVINITLLLLTFGVTFAMILLTLGHSTVERNYFFLYTIQQVTVQLLPLIGDAIVIWRAVALYTEKRWMLIVPCGLFLGTIGLSIWNFVTLGQSMAFLFSLEIPVSIFNEVDRIVEALNPSSLALFLPCSTATNAGATFCIWYKLWSYRKQVRNLGLKKKHSSADQILVLLVESGVFYCALQVVNVFTTYFGGPFGIASSIVFPVYIVFTAMYPSMVVVFVSEKRSVVEEFITSMAQSHVGLEASSHERRPATFGHLSFSSSCTQESDDSMFQGAEATLSSDPLLPRHISGTSDTV